MFIQLLVINKVSPIYILQNNPMMQNTTQEKLNLQMDNDVNPGRHKAYVHLC